MVRTPPPLRWMSQRPTLQPLSDQLPSRRSHHSLHEKMRRRNNKTPKEDRNPACTWKSGGHIKNGLGQLTERSRLPAGGYDMVTTHNTSYGTEYRATIYIEIKDVPLHSSFLQMGVLVIFSGFDWICQHCTYDTQMQIQLKPQHHGQCNQYKSA